MTEAFFNIAERYGISMALVVFVIWDSRSRENKYIQVIDTLTKEIKLDIEKIKFKILG